MEQISLTISLPHLMRQHLKRQVEALDCSTPIEYFRCLIHQGQQHRNDAIPSGHRPEVGLSYWHAEEWAAIQELVKGQAARRKPASH